MTEKELLLAAKEARKKAYAPYSGFLVGAALLTPDGSVFTGCNIENASFGVTCCAERTALFSAVSAGKRSFSAIAIAGGKTEVEAKTPCPPCGVCRQALAEFCPPELLICLADGETVKATTLGELLPGAFTSETLQKKG